MGNAIDLHEVRKHLEFTLDLVKTQYPREPVERPTLAPISATGGMDTSALVFNTLHIEKIMNMDILSYAESRRNSTVRELGIDWTCFTPAENLSSPVENLEAAMKTLSLSYDAEEKQEAARRIVHHTACVALLSMDGIIRLIRENVKRLDNNLKSLTAPDDVQSDGGAMADDGIDDSEGGPGFDVGALSSEDDDYFDAQECASSDEEGENYGDGDQRMDMD